jgi:hypothetical protein
VTLLHYYERYNGQGSVNNNPVFLGLSFEMPQNVTLYRLHWESFRVPLFAKCVLGKEAKCMCILPFDNVIEFCDAG